MSNLRRCITQNSEPDALPTELFRPLESKFDLQHLSQYDGTYTGGGNNNNNNNNNNTDNDNNNDDDDNNNDDDDVNGNNNNNNNNNDDDNNNNNNNNRNERSSSRFLKSPHCAAKCLQHVRSSGPDAIECKSRATHRALITYNVRCAA